MKSTIHSHGLSNMAGVLNYRSRAYPLVRLSLCCPLCERAKRRGNIICESCARLHNVRNLTRSHGLALHTIEEYERSLELQDHVRTTL